MDEKTTQGTPNRIEDKAPKPKGVIPKNTQSLVIIGVAVLMIVIMWLTGGKRAATNTSPAPNPVPPVTPTDTSQLQAFKRKIQAEQQAAAEAQPHFGRSAEGGVGSPRTGAYSSPSSQSGVASPEDDQPASPAQVSYSSETPTTQPQSSPIKADLARREYISLFASNVALTYRKGAAAQKLTGSPAAALSSSMSSGDDQAGRSSESDADAQALRDAQALAGMGPPPGLTTPANPQLQSGAARHLASEPQQPNPTGKRQNPDAPAPGKFNSSTGNKYILFEGTIIPAVLMNRLNGSFSGPVNCLVTEDVYSHDREHVLIPAGTKVLGEAQKVSAFGQERLAVFFHRLIMPDGYSVNLDQFKGLDQEGATALHDKLNNHYARIFGASLAVGILGGIGETSTGNIFTESALDRARAGFGASMAESGEHILDRFLNILPTITIREGTRVNVYLSNDLLSPDYNDHTMPPDL
jgi:type IV secretory pathway VirB10-like protein